MNTLNETELKTVADTLGHIKAELSMLNDEKKRLEKILTDNGVDCADGDLFRVTVSTVNQDRIDWRKVAEHFAPSRQLLTAHTKHSEFKRFNVKARVM